MKEELTYTTLALANPVMSNTAIGYSSLLNNTTGTCSTAIGTVAGRATTGTATTGTITLGGVTITTTTPGATGGIYTYPLYSTITPSYLTATPQPYMGEATFDFETKTMKVYNGAEWITVKMFDRPTDLEIAIKEMKKEISSEF
jgi:hypothetical protein